MVQSTQTATALTPLTVTYDDQTVDLSVPQLSPLAELIPTILRSIGRMDVYGASAGFTVSTSSGQVLDQSLCLRDQGVRAGASLTLERAGQGRDDQRFDDLVEAVGSAVENTVDPWTPLDSLQLSAYASALFVGLAGVLLLSGASQGSSLSGVVSSLNEIRTIAYPIIGAVGALLLTGTAAVVARRLDKPAVAVLANCAPVLLACSIAGALPAGPWTAYGALAAGVALTIGALSSLVLPGRLRASGLTPAIIGVSLGLFGLLSGTLGMQPERISALLAALLLLACLSIPWLAMASTPVRVTGPSAAAQIDPRQIDKSVSMGVSMSVSIRLGTCLALVILAPILCSTSQGIALSALIGAALMLSTRSIRSRVEVLIGVLSGMAVLAWAAYAAALQSATSLLLVLVTSLTGSLLVLATNVVTPKTRPWLSRTADTISTLVIIAVPPFALYMWGM